ncbi:hypothetical protein C7999DRAFT_32791 [Corynascus novoguineensis]|uniref:Short chain dehydrogenase n=1 Tax=Corynascus novoguineensis TaxID=1126955 RepID=A0AAN7CRX5_9PEZI|nr:hypothetical protein C7999DRAFT_32791 [Corynascus novoguineensis]
MPVSITIPSIKTNHKRPYPSISPLRPELSQVGRTVLVLGGSVSIGFAIAKAFVQASTTRVIITGRREAVLANAVTQLEAEAAKCSGTTITGIVSDMADPRASEELWEDLKRDGLIVDVLVLNGMVAGEAQPILHIGKEKVWKAFEGNVRALLDHTERFYKQEGSVQRQKYLVNVSTSNVHLFYTEGDRIPTYSLTKNSGTLLVQQIAKDTRPDDMQIISFHPGAVLSESARKVGYEESSLDWDDENLAGQFAVWCASEEARFMHGRWVPAWWDVDEIKAAEFRGRLESDRHFLRIGVVGI